MKVCIPTIGTEWVLKQDWTFNLWSEYRNETLFKVLGITMPPRPKWEWVEVDGKQVYRKQEGGYVTVTLPKGTLLIVDRIYIRKGSPEFDSVTFRMPGRTTERETRSYVRKSWSSDNWEPDGRWKQPTLLSEETVVYTVPKRPVRFWAKLGHVNMMEVL